MAASGDEPAVLGKAAAVETAQELGEQVEIAEHTTEYERRLANPDGTVTLQAHAVAQRVEQSGGWIPIDTTLGVQSDRVEPAATMVNVSFSNGGSDSLVSLTEGGATLELSWTGPGELPAPVLSEDTATYPDVVAGVDLMVRVDAEAIAMVVKVKSRDAAEDPLLDRVAWDVDVTGGSLEVGDDGSVGLVPDGETEPALWAPGALMWDSPREAESSAMSTLSETDSGEPGRVETMDVEFDGEQLAVTPDQDMLADEDTVYPVHIDPPFGVGHRNWAPVYKSRQNREYPSGSSWPRDKDLMRVGLNTWAGCGSGCGVWRSHVRFSINSISGEGYRIVGKPEFGVYLAHSGDCDPTPVQLWRTKSIRSSGVSWRYMKDRWLTNYGSKSGNANYKTCGQSPEEMTWSTSRMKRNLQGALNRGHKTFTFGLKAKNEGTRMQWKKFYSKSAYLEATFNSVPDKPTAVKAQSGCAGSCSSGATLRITRPTFQAKVENELGGDVRARFELRHAGGSVIATKDKVVDSGAVATWRSGSLKHGKSYKVRVRAKNEDGIWGKWSSYYRFSVDTSRPDKPTSVGVTGECHGSCSSPALLRTRTPRFRADVEHPFSDNLRVSFQVRNSSRKSVVASGTVDPVSAGNVAKWRPSSNLAQEERFHVRVRTKDEYGRRSPWSMYYTFTVDTKAPPAPDVVSRLYQHKDTGTWNGGIGVPGRFTFEAGGAEDVVEFEWAFNGGNTHSKSVSKGASHTTTFTPQSDLIQTLKVRSIDHAGNTSSWRTYEFYVRPQPESAGWWKFDEGSGTEAASEISDAVGTRYGGSGWVSSDINGSVTGDSGHAIKLDGNNDFVRMPPVLSTKHAAGYTVSAWVKLDDLDGYQYVASVNGDNTSIMAMYYHPGSDRWCLRVNGEDDSSSDTRTWACSDVEVQVGEWTYLVGQYDKPAGKVRLWVNGGPTNGEAAPGSMTERDAPAAWSATGSIEFGRGLSSSFGGDLDGAIDEARVRQRVLIESEIVRFYQACLQAPETGETDSCPPAPEPEDVVLVGGWDFEETSGDTTADVSGFASAATQDGVPGWTAFGHNDSRGMASVSRDECTRYSTASPVVTENSFTLAAWVRKDADGGSVVIRIPGPGLGNAVYDPSTSILSRSGDGWAFYVSHFNSAELEATTTQVSGGNTAQGEWAYLVGVYDANAQELRLYVDGVLVDSKLGAISQEAWGIQMGGTSPYGSTMPPTSDCDHALGGTLDSVRVYQGAPSSAEVADWYTDQMVPPPSEEFIDAKASWPMRRDFFEPDLVREENWTGNDGVLTGGASWSDPTQAHAGWYGVEFDGESGEVPLQWSPVDTSESFSVSAWVRLDETDKYRSAVSAEGVDRSAFQLYYPTTTSRLCFMMWHEDADGSDYDRPCAQSDPEIGSWAHVVGVFDKRDRELRLYVDGELAETTAYSGLEPWDVGDDGSLVLGRALMSAEPTRWWDGGIARVQVFDGPIRDAQVAAIYAEQRDRRPVAAVDSPSGDSQWSAGEEISFSGHATDLAGDVSASDLTWTLRMRDCADPEESSCTTEVLQTWTGVETGSFVAPDEAQPHYLELALTAATADGSHTDFMQLDPKLADVAFESNPGGLEVAAGDSAADGPYTTKLIEGATVSIDAAGPQILDNSDYVFDSWEHDGAAVQDVTVPTGGGTFTANYREVDLNPVAVIDSPSAELTWTPGQEITFSGHAANTEQQIPTEQLSWQLIAEYCVEVDDCYLDVLQTWSGVASGSFIAPELPYSDASLTLELTAEKDPERLGVASVELFPVKDPISDDFSADTLNEQLWSVTDPGSAGSVSILGAESDDSRLVLDVPADINYDPYHVNRALRVTQPVADVDFEVEAGFTSMPSLRYQGQGILVEQDEDNWLRWDIYHDGTSLRVYAGATDNGTTTALFNYAINDAPDRLRLTRAGDEWTFAYSDSGAGWTTAGASTHALDVTNVGPLAFSAGPEPGYTAEVDYFFNVASPVFPEDGVNQPPQVVVNSTCQDGVCQFDASQSVDPDGEISGFNWTFDDGQTAVGSTVSHTFETVGIHDAELRVVDDAGGRSTETVRVNSGPAVSDDFSAAALDTQLWSVTDPAGQGSISIVGSGTGDSRLRLDIPSGIEYDPYNENRALRVLQPVANDDFSLAAAFSAAPPDDTQGHGILIEHDAENWLRFDTYRDYVGDLKVYIGATSDGQTSGLFHHTVDIEATHFRISRTGDVFQFDLSDDGETWVDIGSATHSMNVSAVGPMAFSSGPLLGHTAEVDYFFNTESPIDPEDG